MSEAMSFSFDEIVISVLFNHQCVAIFSIQMRQYFVHSQPFFSLVVRAEKVKVLKIVT